MSTTLLTILLAFAVVLLAIIGLGIGYLLGGTVLKGSCGRSANQKKDDSCSTKNTCHVCKPDEKH